MCYYGYVLWACGCAPDNQMRVATALSCLDNGDSCPRSTSLGNLDGSLGRDGKLRLNYICANCQYINNNPEHDPHESSRTELVRPRALQRNDNSHESSRQTNNGQSRTPRNDSQPPSRQIGYQLIRTSQPSNNDSRPSPHRNDNDQTRTPRHRPDRTPTLTREGRQAREDEEDERVTRRYRAEEAAISRRREELLRELERRDTERGSRALMQRYNESRGGDDRGHQVHSGDFNWGRGERYEGGDGRDQMGSRPHGAGRVRLISTRHGPGYVERRVVDEWEEEW